MFTKEQLKEIWKVGEGVFSNNPAEKHKEMIQMGEYFSSPVRLYRIARLLAEIPLLKNKRLDDLNYCRSLNFPAHAAHYIAYYLMSLPLNRSQEKHLYGGINADPLLAIRYAMTFSASGIDTVSRTERDFLTGGEKTLEVTEIDWASDNPDLERVLNASGLHGASAAEMLHKFRQNSGDYFSRFSDYLPTNDEIFLAESFANKLVHKADSIRRPPLIGAFRMTPPKLADLRFFWKGEFRLVVKKDCLYLGYIDERGKTCLCYWSPDKGDTIAFSFPPPYRWAINTFLSCLWYDLKRTETEIIKRYVPKNPEYRQQKKRAGEPIVRLPRKIWQLEWGHTKSKDLYEKYSQESENDKPRRSPRAHYRRLAHDHWEASEQAILNAEAWYMPEPPPGFTFVCPQGEPPQNVPRIVDTGINIAAVALGGWAQ